MKIQDSLFTIVANGSADGPSQALRDYLLKHNAKGVHEITHPLVPEGDNLHISTFHGNDEKSSRSRRLPHSPPFTYILDPFFPLSIKKDSIWFGFNNLSCLRGLLRRKIGRTGRVVYWAVDFVPNRFGSSLATRIYDWVDAYVSTHVDLRVELSQAALDGRNLHLKTKKRLAPGYVAPMGAWLDRTPKTNESTWESAKVVYLGHLVARQGVVTLVKAIAILLKQGVKVDAEIVGSGPLRVELEELAEKLGTKEFIKFHGFVEDHKDVEAILASGAVAVAPYVKDKTTFTQFADPGKLKAYLGANLPIVLTEVPPNARDLSNAGVALLVEDSPEALAAGPKQFLIDKERWLKAHRASRMVAREFDWNTIMGGTLKELGFE